MTAEQVGGIARAILSAAGGYLVGKGVIDSETALAITGAGVTIATAVWSVWAKRAA
ncbi:MAG: hypothetical protein V4720_06260 [Pseudomonadota bacterium]